MATTRPETMLGDTAVAVHPKDQRYAAPRSARPRSCRSCAARSRSSPTSTWTRSSAPARSRSRPAHDPNDFEMGKRHDLAPIVVIDERRRDERARRRLPRARPLRGAQDDRRGARRPPAYLRARSSRTATRSGTATAAHTVIEPYLSRQWFVRMKPLAEPAHRGARRRARCKFFPARWKKVYLHWMDEHPRLVHLAPALVGAPHPGLVPATTGHAVRPVGSRSRARQCGRAALTQDEDVLDTWFSSWLWPFSTLGWPEETADLTRFYPTQPLVTGPRHHLLLGGAHDHGRARVHGRGAVPARLLHRHRARRAGAQDVEVARQLARPARADRRATAPTRCASPWCY